MRPRVVVVGGGISGLAAAYDLHQHQVDVTLLEASNRFGGPIRTERIDDFIVDAGPDSFLSTKSGGLELAERLGISDRLVSTREDGGGTFIVRDGELHPLPEGITLLVPTQFDAIAETSLLDFRGKARLLGDYFIPSRRDTDDESVASFMTRRVGRQAFERLAEPLLSGIYAGDAHKLGILSTFPRLRDVEKRHGGLIRGAMAIRRNAPKGPERRYSPFVSFRYGLGELIDTLLDGLKGADVRRNAAATRIARSDSGYRVEVAGGSVVDADGVILASPAGPAADMISNLMPRVASDLRDIPYVSSATVSMAFRESDVSDRQLGRGFVVPRIENRVLTAVTWSSNKFAGRAPDGMTLLRGFAGRDGREEHAELPDGKLIERILADLFDITGISAEPVWTRVYRWRKAMPQYHVGHQERLQRIETQVRAISGLEVTGAAYRGVGIPDCIVNAQAAAQRILGDITGQPG